MSIFYKVGQEYFPGPLASRAFKPLRYCPSPTEASVTVQPAPRATREQPIPLTWPREQYRSGAGQLPPVQAPALEFSASQEWTSLEKLSYTLELILGRLTAMLCDYMIIDVVPAEPIGSKNFKISIYTYRFDQQSPTSFTHTHTHTPLKYLF